VTSRAESSAGEWQRREAAIVGRECGEFPKAFVVQRLPRPTASRRKRRASAVTQTLSGVRRTRVGGAECQGHDEHVRAGVKRSCAQPYRGRSVGREGGRAQLREEGTNAGRGPQSRAAAAAGGARNQRD
jgi:hypothetical protein